MHFPSWIWKFDSKITANAYWLLLFDIYLFWQTKFTVRNLPRSSLKNPSLASFMKLPLNIYRSLMFLIHTFLLQWWLVIVIKEKILTKNGIFKWTHYKYLYKIVDVTFELQYTILTIWLGEKGAKSLLSHWLCHINKFQCPS